MPSDADFLAKLQAEPADDTTRIVYADWLEEQGDPVSIARANFLRLTVRAAEPEGTKREQKALSKQLQHRAAALDTSWLAVVSRMPIENCQGKRAQAESGRAMALQFEFLCDRRWEELAPTTNPAVRACDACQQSVHYCDTITEARRHAWQGHCIAVDLGVIRREQDLEPERMWLGRPSVETLRREGERMEPDAVSAERERRKHPSAGQPS